MYEKTYKSAFRTTELEIWNLIKIKGLYAALNECRNKLIRVKESLNNQFLDEEKRAYQSGIVDGYIDFIQRH